MTSSEHVNPAAPEKPAPDYADTGAGGYAPSFSYYAPPPPPKLSWRKRHPVLFWGLIVFALVVLHSGFQQLKTSGPLSNPKVAVINVEGMIMDSGAIVRWIETVRTDSGYKAAVVHINSPGGAVAPSQELYQAVKRLDADKPVIVSMGALAASGGYYTALGGRELYANPSTLTASIGVKMQLTNVEALMRIIGISEKTLSTGSLKDAGSPMRPLTPKEEAYFQSLIDAMFEEFVGTVALERSLTREAVLAVADGRVMTGRQALDAKLVDHIGDRHDALARAKELGKIAPEATADVVEGPEKPASFLRELIGAVFDVAAERQAEASHPVFMY